MLFNAERYISGDHRVLFFALDDLLHGTFLPGNSGVRATRSEYEAKTRSTQGDGDEDFTCKKKTRKAQFKLPGIFLYTCPHGVILGYVFSAASKRAMMLLNAPAAMVVFI